MAGSNMLIDETGLRIAAGAYVGVPLGVMAAGLAAAAPVFALRNAGWTDPQTGRVHNRPWAVSRAALKMATGATAFTQGAVRLELVKTTSSVNHSGGNAFVAQRKKLSSYEAITAAELQIQGSDTAALSGGTHTPQGVVDTLLLSGTIPAGESIWLPHDGLPLVVEQGEGLVVLATVPATGVWTGFVGLDLFRF